MTVKSQLENSLKDAMRSGDDLRKRVLRMAMAAIKQVEIDKRITLDDPATLAILQKELKSRHETIADAERANRPDIIAAARDEITVLEDYLPKALSPQELEDLAHQAIQEAGATSPAHMGAVMKLLMPRIQGRAPGDAASQVVRKLLMG
jgi:hypothetical protein